MRRIKVKDVEEAVRKLCMEVSIQGSDDLLDAYNEALSLEESELGKDIIKEYIKNLELAKSLGIPICQDTGLAVIFLEIGQDLSFEGGYLLDAVEEGVRRGYQEGFLRNSVVDPITRSKLPGYNTPPVVHTEIVPGDRLRIMVMAKGFGSENMSEIRMLPPSSGVEGIKNFVVGVVEKAGANPCPPVVVGVGIGGTMEKAALLAKKALFRRLGERNRRKEVAELELEILHEINKLGIGPQGFGGRVTAFDVRIETYPTHIASIPVAVNIQCHVSRHGEVVL